MLLTIFLATISCSRSTTIEMTTETRQRVRAIFSLVGERAYSLMARGIVWVTPGIFVGRGAVFDLLGQLTGSAVILEELHAGILLG